VPQARTFEISTSPFGGVSEEHFLRRKKRMKRVKLNERSWLGRRSFRNLSNPSKANR
jgi:hypothetical protein